MGEGGEGLFRRGRGRLNSLVSVRGVVVLFFCVRERPAFVCCRGSLSFGPAGAVYERTRSVDVEFFIGC